MADNRDINRELEQRRLDLTNPELRHEGSDVDVWAIGKFAIGLILITIVSVALLFGLFHYFQVRENATQAPPSGINVDARKLPPEPRLQDSAVQDLQQMRSAEDKILSGYGWVDQQHGIVRMPIERAMDLVVQRGLPSRQGGAQTAAGNVSIPMDSGLGQKMQQPGGPLASELSQPIGAPANPQGQTK